MKFEKWRKNANKTQEQVAIDLGIDQSAVCNWELGKRIPERENMQKIVAYTDGEVQPNDFYEVSNDKSETN